MTTQGRPLHRLVLSFFAKKHDTAIPAGRHRTDKAARRTRRGRVLENGMNITEAEFDALEYVAAVGRVATHDGPHISSLLERLRPFAKRETDSPQAVASTSEPPSTPGEGTVQKWRTCHRCGGDGIQLTEVNTYGEATCGTCGGSGRVADKNVSYKA